MAWMRQKSETSNETPPQNHKQTSQPALQARPAESAPEQKREPQMEKRANVGQTVKIKGEVTAQEDLTIEGQIEGQISLPGNALTIGANGRVNAQVMAKTVMILGQVKGDIVAKEKVDVAPSGSVEGDIRSPRVAIADGARFKGSIDMETGNADRKQGQHPNQNKQHQQQQQEKDQRVAMAAS